MASKKKQITIEFSKNTVGVDFNKMDSFTDLLVGLATLEGIVGGIMEADKATIRTAVDEIQNELQAKMPEGAE